MHAFRSGQAQFGQPAAVAQVDALPEEFLLKRPDGHIGGLPVAPGSKGACRPNSLPAAHAAGHAADDGTWLHVYALGAADQQVLAALGNGDAEGNVAGEVRNELLALAL